MTEETKNESLEALVGRARNGDRGAMEELYRQTNNDLWRTVRAMTKNDEDAMDIVQESYLRAFTELPKLKKTERFLPWLKKIAINEQRQELRKRQPLLFSELTTEDGDAMIAEFPPAPSAEQIVEQKEQSAAVRQALAKLSDGQRTVLVLYYCEQYSVQEIAQQLGLSKNTVRVQLFRGRKTLEAALQKDGAPAEGAVLAAVLMNWKTGQAVKTTASFGASVLSRLPTMHVKTAAAVLLQRIALGGVTVAAVAGLTVGTVALTKYLRARDMRIPDPPVTVWVETDDPTAPTKPIRLVKTEQPTQPSEDEHGVQSLPPATPAEPPPETEPPATPADAQKPVEPKPTEPKPTAPPATPADPLPTTQATPPDAPEPIEQTEPTEETEEKLPTENPFPFTYQEITLTVGENWTSRFETGRMWIVSLSENDPEDPSDYNWNWHNYVSSRMSGGTQIITVEAVYPGTYTYSLQIEEYSLQIPWLKMEVLKKED